MGDVDMKAFGEELMEAFPDGVHGTRVRHRFEAQATFFRLVVGSTLTTTFSTAW